jgi:hypothetical protein
MSPRDLHSFDQTGLCCLHCVRRRSHRLEITQVLNFDGVWVSLDFIGNPLEAGRRLLDLFVAVSHSLTSQGRNLKNVGRSSIAWMITGSSPP